MFCKFCGREIPEKLTSVGFCPFCGETLTEGQHSGAEPSGAGEKPRQAGSAEPVWWAKSTVRKFALFTFVALSVVLAALIFDMPSNQSGGSQPNTEANATVFNPLSCYGKRADIGGLGYVFSPSYFRDISHMGPIDAVASEDDIDKYLLFGGDLEGMARLLTEGKVFRLEPNTEVRVDDISPTGWRFPSSWDKVLILAGDHVTEEAWVEAQFVRSVSYESVQSCFSRQAESYTRYPSSEKKETSPDTSANPKSTSAAQPPESYENSKPAGRPPNATGGQRLAGGGEPAGNAVNGNGAGNSPPESVPGRVRACEPYGAPFLGTDIPHGPLCFENLATGEKFYTVPSKLLQDYRDTVLRGWSHICVPYLRRHGLETQFVATYGRQEAALLKKLESLNGVRFGSLDDADKQIEMLGSEVGKLANAVVEDPRTRAECQSPIRGYLDAPQPMPPANPGHGIVASPTPRPGSEKVEIPAGTTVEVLTAGTIASGTNHTGDMLSASLAVPIFVNSRLVLPKGADIFLRALQILSAHHRGELTEIRVVLDHLDWQGQSYPLDSSSFDLTSSSDKQLCVSPGTRIEFQLLGPVDVAGTPGSGAH